MQIPLGSPAASVYQLGKKRQTLSNNITLEKRQTAEQIEQVRTSIAEETERATNAEITSIVKEYALSNTGLIAPTTGWSETFPEPSAVYPYVWSRIVTVNGAGTTYSTPTVEAGYKTISQAAITANNIANGSEAVPRVSSTGVDINGDTLEIKSTGKIQMLGNSELFFGTASSNSGVKMNNAGIAIGSGADIAIAAGGQMSIISGGSFTVDSGNFSIDSQGNVNFASGTAGNFQINENYIGSASDGVYMRKNVYSGGMLLSGGIFVHPNSGNTTVFQATRDGTVFINGGTISNGWIADASVSGDTLTLTKWDGTTVNFTKPASATIGDLLIESVSGYTNRFAANQYNSGNTSIVNAATCEMYLDESTYTRNTWACVREVGGSRVAYLNLGSYWDAAQSDFYEVTQTTLQPVHISIQYTDERVTVFYNDQTFKVYYGSA